MELKVTRYHVENDGVATVAFDRPTRGNSWTSRMNAEYRWLMREADRDPAVRVIVVTGTGRQFCVGADHRALDFYAKGDQDYVETVDAKDFAKPGYGIRDEFDHELVWQWGLQKPVLCAINGACAGIAVAIAGFCDLRYAVAGAKLTTATARLGLPAEYGLSWLLPRIVGVTHAADILLTGRIFTSEEALRMGFLNEVFPEAEFEERIRQTAHAIATTVSPRAARTTKRQLYRDLLASNVGESIEDSKRRIHDLMQGPDFSEGISAFRAKRAPAFVALDEEMR